MHRRADRHRHDIDARTDVARNRRAAQRFRDAFSVCGLRAAAQQRHDRSTRQRRSRALHCPGERPLRCPIDRTGIDRAICARRGDKHALRLRHSSANGASGGAARRRSRDPAGHSSSYPPHKHDVDAIPSESILEETYYHRLDPSQGFAFQRVYTDSRDIDAAYAVENHDVVMVPRGYHPVVAPHGYNSYYLNVMAGPKRVWHFKNDPAHEWMLSK